MERSQPNHSARTATSLGRASLLTVLLVLILGWASPTAVGAQDTDAESEATSLLESWRETLIYGIDSEVISILEQIEQSGEVGLNDELITRFSETRNDDLRTEILEYFTRTESTALADPVERLLLSDTLLDNDLLRVSAAYISRVVNRTSPELLAAYGEIAEDGDLLAASVAIGAIGSDGSAEAIALLLDLYEEADSTDVRSAVIRALGDAGSTEGLPLLTTIVADEFEESALRQYAAESLGKIGSEESVPLLTQLLSSDDSNLRAYATHALGYYDTDETRELLVDALRDSFWRVRVAALEGLAEQGAEHAIDAIAYKARRDPERPVREEAIRTLSRVDGSASFEVLADLATNERIAQAERILSIEVLADREPTQAAETFAEIVAEEWDREGSRLLDAVGRMISEHPHAAFEPLYVRLLSHPNFVVRIYAMRGIGGAGISEHVEQLKQIARDNPPGLVRRTAIASLSRMGIDYDPEPEPEESDSPADADLESGTTE
ncbi:MAG: HEAT repeat domain-containing protein [Spirochaetota bacterium]